MNKPTRLQYPIRFLSLTIIAAISLSFPPHSIAETLFPTFEQTIQAPGPQYPKWWGRTPEFTLKECENPGKCLACHQDHTSIDSKHAFKCTTCHKGDPEADDKAAAHQGLIPNPGDLAKVSDTCGKCHPKEAERVAGSRMALAPRMIGHTRFAFGAQSTPEPEFGATKAGNLAIIPEPKESGSLGDDLLRRSCLRCHLNTKGSKRFGEHRGIGCSACHVPYPNTENGEHSHAIVRNTGMTACLKCHNANHVGGDYIGLFEKDYDRGFRSPFVHGRQPPRIYGSEQHFLSADLHYRAVLQCMDCHTLDDVHGSGKGFSSRPQVSVSCESCHVKGDHPRVVRVGNDFSFTGAERRKIPKWKQDIIPHSVSKHSRLRCNACHAAWSYQDYGRHFMLEERADYWKWSTTAAQNDPQIQELLLRNIGTEAELIEPRQGHAPAKPEPDWKKPFTFDWLSGEYRPGAWFHGFTERVWSRPPLGNDGQGRIAVMRPFQIVVSHIDKDSNLLADRIVPTTGSGSPALLFNPYSPHTIAKSGRACQECHGNPKAAGLGEGIMSQDGKFTPLAQPETLIPGHEFSWHAMTDTQGKRLQESSYPGAGPLDPETVARLLNPSRLFRATWFRFLNQGKD
jgi:hypothetical protein